MTLSNREWQVVKQLLQGKSNKLIAASLGISIRTVEFHLKNIYAKYQVASRLELVLKLANQAVQEDSVKLGSSTVVPNRRLIENRGKWSASSRSASAIFNQEWNMKTILKSKHVLVGGLTALVTGFVLVGLLILAGKLMPANYGPWIAPLAVVLAAIGVMVGWMGQRNGSSLVKVGLSAWLGTGLSTLGILPALLWVVMPIGKLFERFGWIDRAAMPADTATTLAIISALLIWLVIGAGVGTLLTFLNIKKSPGANVQGLSEQHL